MQSWWPFCRAPVRSPRAVNGPSHSLCVQRGNVTSRFNVSSTWWYNIPHPWTTSVLSVWELWHGQLSDTHFSLRYKPLAPGHNRQPAFHYILYSFVRMNTLWHQYPVSRQQPWSCPFIFSAMYMFSLSFSVPDLKCPLPTDAAWPTGYFQCFLFFMLNFQHLQLNYFNVLNI